uniref:Cytochrome P450 n=1 Tax=Cannabis sativa TaxID=3483 RepID=A0A803P5L8_CANSA
MEGSNHEASLLVMIFFMLLLVISVIKYLFHKIMDEKPHSSNAAVLVPLPPGPSPWPILGCIPEMLRNRPTYKWIHTLMKELDTDIACIRLGTSTHVISVTSPEIAREFLKKHDKVFASRPLTGVTRLISRDYKETAFAPWSDQWKKMRRVLVSNVLNRSTLAWLLPKRTQEADNLVRFVYNHSSAKGEGEVVNVRIAAQQYIGGVMRKMMFGKRYFGEGKEDGGPGREEEEHVEAVIVMLLHIYAFSVSDFLPWLRWLDLDGHQRIVGKAVKVMKKLHDPIIKDRIREWREGDPSISRRTPNDLLDVLVSLKDSDGTPLLSDDEIRAQIMDLFLAAIDNPYNATEWALSEMLNQPEMLEKATKEIDRVVGNKTTLLQESHIPQLPYLIACLREALRLHPVTPFNVPHVSIADCTVAGYFIPKGSSVLLGRFGLGHNPNVWDQPLRFNPDRHLPEKRRDLSETELRFISFTTGRRGCVGVELGTNMAVMLLGRLLQGFTWTIPEGMESIDLSSGEGNSIFKAKPLYAHATPRLNPSLYLSLSPTSALG